jgi:Calx-beta domain
VAPALTALLLTSSVVVVSGDARAERFILKSGEAVEGSIIQATRNTVIIQRSIGGMRQMSIEDIGEVRLDLAPGRQITGQFLGWAEGVYEVGSGDEIVRVSESGILSREPREQTARLLPTQPSRRQQSTAAAARSTAPAGPSPEPAAAPASEGQNRNRAAAEAGSDADAASAQSAAVDDAERQASNTEAQAAADQASNTDAQAAAGPESKESGTESQAAADTQTRAAAEPGDQAAAGEEHAALGDQGILAVKASVDPPEPGARSMTFNIELSQPAKQTVVLIYGTVDGTAKAGEDYEAKQGMVTLEPGATNAEVRVPLIQGAPQDGEKRFELVLMADPKIAEVVDRRVIATIKGAD